MIIAVVEIGEAFFVSDFGHFSAVLFFAFKRL
jgi:hypothetical protein